MIFLILIHGYFSQIKLSITSLYLEDINDLPDLPDCHDDTWSHHHQSGFDLRFPKIYDTLVFVANKVIRTFLYLKDIPDIPDGDHDTWRH